MNYSLAAFQEPRGVMRILQFIFAIVAFSTTLNYTGSVELQIGNNKTQTYLFEYPFRIEEQDVCTNKKTHQKYTISADVSSDAQFFVATGILSMLYCIFIVAVYAVIDELYRTKSEFPLADFFLTTILAIFWLSGSAAWSNGTQGLKRETDPEHLRDICADFNHAFTSTFSKLNISLIVGFLNFFLWASDLWFIYKETIWFQGRQGNQSNIGNNSGGITVGPNV